MSDRRAASLLGISHPRALLDETMLLTMARRLRPQMVEYLKVFGLTDAEAVAGSARVLARVDAGALASQEADLTPVKEIKCIEQLMEVTVASFKSDMAMRNLLDGLDDSCASADSPSSRQQQRRKAKRRARKDKLRQRRTRLVLPAATSVTDPADLAPDNTLFECRLCLEDVDRLATIVHADGSECQCVCATCAAIMPSTCLRCFMPIVHWFQEC